MEYLQSLSAKLEKKEIDDVAYAHSFTTFTERNQDLLAKDAPHKVQIDKLDSLLSLISVLKPPSLQNEVLREILVLMDEVNYTYFSWKTATHIQRACDKAYFKSLTILSRIVQLALSVNGNEEFEEVFATCVSFCWNFAEHDGDRRYVSQCGALDLLHAVTSEGTPDGQDICIGFMWGLVEYEYYAVRLTEKQTFSWLLDRLMRDFEVISDVDLTRHFGVLFCLSSFPSCLRLLKSTSLGHLVAVFQAINSNDSYSRLGVFQPPQVEEEPVEELEEMLMMFYFWCLTACSFLDDAESSESIAQLPESTTLPPLAQSPIPSTPQAPLSSTPPSTSDSPSPLATRKEAEQLVRNLFHKGNWQRIRHIEVTQFYTWVSMAPFVRFLKSSNAVVYELGLFSVCVLMQNRANVVLLDKEELTDSMVSDVLWSRFKDPSLHPEAEECRLEIMSLFPKRVPSLRALMTREVLKKERGASFFL